MLKIYVRLNNVVQKTIRVTTRDNTTQHKTTQVQHDTTQVQYETTRVQHDTIRDNTSTPRDFQSGNY